MHPIDAYARTIISGKRPAGRYHRLACERHERDARRQGTRAFPFVLRYDLADRFFHFTEQLKHYKGEWAGRTIELEPHQLFRLGSVIGWVHRDTSLRRFRTAYNELPRKNGKSLEAAMVALYVTFFDGEPGAEGYCIATKRDQAKIVFNDAKKLIESSGLRARITVLSSNLNLAATASKLEPLGADYDSTDGLNPNLIITDEFHAQKNRELLDVMETATGARRQPLNFQITTAGNDPVSPCGDQHDYACKLLDRVIVDESFFAFIAHAESGDDWTAVETWRKANPNYGVSVKPEDMRALATKARNMEAATAAFKQKRLNLWVNAILPWLSIDGWRRGQSSWSLDEMAGQPCWVGIDLSSKIDLTAVVFVFPPTSDRASWRLYAWTLTPAETLEQRERRDRAPYGQWVKAGLLATNPGNRIDQGRIVELLRDMAARVQIQRIGIDPWNAGNLVQALMDEGFQVVEIPQTLAQMSAPSKDFEADVLDGLVDGGRNPLLQWCVSNVVVQRDNKDNIFPVKKKSRGRIDPVIAALMGRKLAAIDLGVAPAAEPDLVVA